MGLDQEKTMLLDYSGITLRKLNSGSGELASASSLRVMIIMRERKRQLTKVDLPERVVSNILDGYKFVDRLGVRRPRMSAKRVAHDDLPAELNQTVVKPLHGRGSMGVYAVFNENFIQNVKTSEMLAGRQALTAQLNADLQAGVTRTDKWIIEELVTEDGNPKAIARDLTFYCFYGRVAHVMEVIRDPDSRYCFWDRDGKHKEVGGRFVDDLFVGRGFTPDMLETAERISAAIPTPFLRIDFHSTGSELVFCKFTPIPGEIWEYGKEIDEQLGDYYLEAQSRLYTDLLNGKRFDAYNASYKNYLKMHTPKAAQAAELLTA